MSRDSLILACPACDSLNRLPTTRLGDAPNCGKCHAPLFQQRPIALDLNNFEIHSGRADLPLLVDFWAPWCGPCRAMAPAFEEAARLLEPGVRLAKVNTEDEPSLAARYGIRSIPTLVLFRGGREVARQAGAMNADGIVRWVRAQAH
ncbi:MAG: thioredoxin TrxC [Zoogloeaceae bacterium]|nr:thioredoxin TrxC [Rhodocyclaceae bacterium]MCP5234822.1 thioredoxin TrxC [Zoogloeaceae bacterium]